MLALLACLFVRLLPPSTTVVRMVCCVATESDALSSSSSPASAVNPDTYLKLVEDTREQFDKKRAVENEYIGGFRALLPEEEVRLVGETWETAESSLTKF